MQNSQPQIICLKYNKIMEYEWGSQNQNCLINSLRQEEHKHYSELWMGTHKNGPSKLQNGKLLIDHLKQKNCQPLPFLFKILCIEKSLSLQLHPNKTQAQRLFAKSPHIYPDDNEKPEMFITMSQFQCFFGIISHSDLKRLITISPFSQLKSKHSQNIKQIITQLLQIPQILKIQYIAALLKNIGSIFPERVDILLKLQEQFPNDIGIIVSCLLKYKVLPSGTCFGIAPGVPHGYLRGTCFQIMKSSDNVVRLGLTPKLKDVDTMLQIMNDQIDLEGIEVHQTEQGFCWNGLSIKPIRSKGEDKQICLTDASIGIITQGSFSCEDQKIKTKRGDVLYFTPGKYVLKGQFVIYFGGYKGQ